MHERRVGHNADGSEWRLSHLSLEIYDASTGKLVAQDSSPIDSVHQVANCKRQLGDKLCAQGAKAIRARIRVKLLSTEIDGNKDEPFAIAFG